MPDLVLTWPGGTRRFTESDSPIQVGRSAAAVVQLRDGSVSRRHLTFTWHQDEWEVDDSSTHGTYRDDGSRLPQHWQLEGQISLRLGGTEGVLITAETDSLAHSEIASESVSEVAMHGDGARHRTSVVVANSVEPSLDESVVEPTGAHPTIGLSPNSITDSALRIAIDGQDHIFFPGTEVLVGRGPSSTVRLGERHSMVSRRHLRASHRDGSWWLEDLSSKGSWIDRRRIKAPYKAEGTFFVNLGDAEAGTAMKVITAGKHRPPISASTPLLATLSLAALLPLAALLFVLLRGSETTPDLAAAKQATVMLFGLDGGQGSGFFVADDLIVTNQHVAALSPQLLVGVSREADEPAQIEYATELLENHPFLDIAVLRVSNRARLSNEGPEIESGPVGTIGLPVATIGDSSKISIGDQVFTTGFPGRLSITASDNMGVLRLPAVVVASGQLANFGLWPGCSNPAIEAFIPAQSPPGVGCAPQGDIDRGVLLSDFRSSEGASGSPVFTNDNLVVGVVYAGSPQDSSASLDIASAAFADWLSEILESGR